MKKSTKELPNDETEEDVEIATRKRYISPNERKQIIEELRLILERTYIFRNYWWININLRYISPKERQQIIN